MKMPAHDILQGVVESVSLSPVHGFSKVVVPQIMLLTGLGVEGDAHQGVTVKHRSRVAVDPAQPNLRQVHLIQAELFDELHAMGFHLRAGDMGENVTTRGLDLLGLPRGALLHLGAQDPGMAAVVEITGLRNPCRQIDDFQPGLLRAVLGRDAQGGLIRKAGVMGIVRHGAMVKAGDLLRVTLPDGPHERLERV